MMPFGFSDPPVKVLFLPCPAWRASRTTRAQPALRVFNSRRCLKRERAASRKVRSVFFVDLGVPTPPGGARNGAA